MFILLPSALGGIKSSRRGNRIETGKNLNPVQKIWGEVGTFGGNSPPPPKMPRINTADRSAQSRQLSAAPYV
jgi:hypothetical protein